MSAPVPTDPQDAPEPQPVAPDGASAPLEATAPQAAESLPTYLADPTDPPGEGFAALHYSGDASMKRAGFVFAPDSVVVVPESVANALAGREGLRIVQESAESWPHFIAMRARLNPRPS